MILNFTNLFFVHEKPRYINVYAHFITNEIPVKILENTAKVPIVAPRRDLCQSSRRCLSEIVFVIPAYRFSPTHSPWQTRFYFIGFSGIISGSIHKKRGLRLWILVRLCSLTLSLLFWCCYSLFCSR